MDWGKNIGCGLLTLAAMLALALVILGIVMGYQADRDIGSWMDRAQVAADASDISIYVKTAMRGLENYSLTDGYCAIIFKKPDNDLGLNYLAYERIAKRADNLHLLDHSSDAYQSGVDDLRGTTREIAQPGFGCMMAQEWIWVTILWWIDIGLWIALCIVALVSDL